MIDCLYPSTIAFSTPKNESKSDMRLRNALNYNNKSYGQNNQNKLLRKKIPEKKVKFLSLACR